MQEPDARAKLVRDQLLIDQDAIFEDTVDKARNILRLDENGRPHPQTDLSKYGAKQKIEWFLVGRYLGSAAKLVASDTAGDQEMAKFFGLPIQEVQKRVHDLKAAGKLEAVEPGTYRLTEARLSEVLRDLGVD